MLTGLIVCSSPSWVVLLAAGVIGQRMSLSCPRVQLRICRSTGACRVALAKLADVLGSFTCKYCLFSKLLINVSGGLLMCKWVRLQLTLDSNTPPPPPLPHPQPRHSVCAEAQSCLRRRDSQISRRGAKPVDLSTREPLGVFNSGSSPLFFCIHGEDLFMRVWVCVCVSMCVFMGVHYLPTVPMFTYLYHSPISSPGASLASEYQRVHKWNGEKDERDSLVSCMELLHSQRAYRWPNLRIKALRIQLWSYECK